MPKSKKPALVGRFGRALGGGLLLIVLLGCGQKTIYPVAGQLVDPDGNPITGMEGGAVEFESAEAKSSANGSVDAQGRFRLTTERPGDGAHVGKHRVAVTRPYTSPDTPAPYVIHPKYETFATSGLEVTVEPKSNDITLKVERYKGKKR